MSHKKNGKAVLALLLSLVVLLLMPACGTAVGPSQTVALPSNGFSDLASVPETEAPVSADILPVGSQIDAVLLNSDLPEAVFDVSSVDEFLAAIGPDRVIRLADGVYNLSRAATYGQPVENDCWYWADGYDGFQLQLFGIRNLFLIGSGAERCSIVTEPRYANVLSFSGCENLTVAGLNIGHTISQGYCSGGVLTFDMCRRVAVNACDLYGCGTEGITASNCSDFVASDTTIRDCTYGSITAYSCQNFRFVNGKILNCGFSRDPEHADGWIGFNLIHAESCSGFAIVNSEISGNCVQELFTSYDSNYYILGCEVRNNRVGFWESGFDTAGVPYRYSYGAVFNTAGAPITLSQTSFSGNTVFAEFFKPDGDWAESQVVDFDGNPLDQTAIENMVRGVFPTEELDVLFPAESVPDTAGDPAQEGQDVYSALREVHAATADEFLAAIGDNTIIHVETELLDLSTASDYGGFGGSHYYWVETYDGPGLVISGVSNLYIIGQGKEITSIQTAPRYADVLFFDGCSDIYIGDLSAGHRKDISGSCSGDVFEFINCAQITVGNCGLFGCGVCGIVATQCSGFSIFDTEIYECSWIGAQLYNCLNFNFTRCSVHDCSRNTISLIDSGRILWDDHSLVNGENQV